jgi:hypothetical protein
MSGKVLDETEKSNSSTVALFVLVLAIFGGLAYIYKMGGGSEGDKPLSGSDAYRCLNGNGLNKMSDDEFENKCLDKSFSVVAYPKDCTFDNDCELSLSNPKLPGFDSDTLFEADLVKKISFMDEKLEVKGVITDRGFMGQVEVEISSQQVVPLSAKEKSEIEEARKPKVDPVAEAQNRWLEERAAENAKMREYADKNGKELTAKSSRVQVDPDSVNGMAEYRYYLKNGKIVSCLRGFEADVFIYECKNFNFN